ncbi:hypothetical protein N8156_04995, partial [Rhodospirillaceae bacterium]|nr:hypothetical protein [Rhodospirillaceae bacterium]
VPTHIFILGISLKIKKPSNELPIRACQCSFCRKHNVRATADPDGELEISVIDKTKLSKYSMGLGVTDFLVCKECGVYVSAVMFDEQNKQMIGNCIVNALDLDQAEVKLSEAAHYDDESKTTRLERRRGRWMKVTLV